MSKRFRLRFPRPALVLAALALMVALGGTAAAGGGHADARQDKALIKKVAKNLKVKYAKKAGQANLATTATNATHATNADSATNATNATTASNSNQLQGFAANQLVRATTASAGNTGDPCGATAALVGFGSTTFTDVVSKSITAPVAGVLVISGRVASEFASASPAGSSLRLLGRLTVDGTAAGPESETSLADSSASCKEGRSMALSTAVAVTAGDHTVALQVAKSTITGGTGLAYVGNGSFTTIFVPFGNAGTQGVLGIPSHVDRSHGAGNR